MAAATRLRERRAKSPPQSPVRQELSGKNEGNTLPFSIIMLITGLLSGLAGLFPNKAAQLATGLLSEHRLSLLNESLLRMLATTFFTASILALCLKDAAETRNLKNSVYTRLSTTLAMHALLFLGLVSFSFNEFTRAGYIGLAVAMVIQLAIAAMHVVVATGGIGGLRRVQDKLARKDIRAYKGFFADVGKQMSRFTGPSSIAYGLLTVAFLASGLIYLVVPTSSLQGVYHPNQSLWEGARQTAEEWKAGTAGDAVSYAADTARGATRDLYEYAASGQAYNDASRIGRQSADKVSEYAQGAARSSPVENARSMAERASLKADRSIMGRIKGFFSGVFAEPSTYDRASYKASEAAGSAQDAGRRAYDAAADTASDTIDAARTAPHRAYKSAEGAASAAAGAARDTARDVHDVSGRAYRSAENAAGSAAGAAHDTQHRVGGAVGAAADYVLHAPHRAYDAVKDTLTGASEATQDAAHDAAGRVQDAASRTYEAGQRKVEHAGKVAKDLPGQAYEAAGQTYDAAANSDAARFMSDTADQAAQQGREAVDQARDKAAETTDKAKGAARSTLESLQDAEQSTLGFLSSMWSKAQGVYKRNVVDPDLPGRVKETAQEAYNAAGNAAAHAQKMTREMYDPTTYNLTSASPSSTISRLLWRLIGLGHWVTSAIMYTLKELSDRNLLESGLAKLLNLAVAGISLAHIVLFTRLYLKRVAGPYLPVLLGMWVVSLLVAVFGLLSGKQRRQVVGKVRSHEGAEGNGIDVQEGESVVGHEE